MSVERPTFLVQGAETRPTQPQSEAIDAILLALKEIRRLDVDLAGRETIEIEVMGMGARSFALFADRGMGKTSVLLTVAKRLLEGSDAIPLWPPIDARALEDSDTVLSTVLARLAAKAREGLELPGDKEEIQTWAELQQAAWKSHAMYARFVAATAASAPEFAAYLVDRSRGTERLRAAVTRAVGRWLSRIGRQQVVVFIDDLDQSSGRAAEALLDLERYVSGAGIAFVFAFKYETLRHQVAHAMFRGLDAPLCAAETENFLRKTLPTDRRADLWEIAPDKRLSFGGDGKDVGQLLRSALPKDAWHLFWGSGDSEELAGTHADLLPGSPRGLTTLFNSLPRGLLSGGARHGVAGGATQEGVRKVLKVAEHLAQAQDIFAVMRLVTRLQQHAMPVGDRTGLAHEVSVRLQRHLPGAWGDKELRATTVDVLVRDPVEGTLPPIVRLVGMEGNLAIDARWQEFLWDLAMYLDPQAAWEAFARLSLLDDLLVPFLRVTAADVKPAHEEWYMPGADPAHTAGYSLLEILRSNLGCVPDALRAQEAYLQAMKWLHRPQRVRWKYEAAKGQLPEPHLREALEEMACAHLTAVLLARGVPMKTSPARDARRLADHLKRILGTKKVRAPEIGRFLAIDAVRAVMPEGHDLLRAAWDAHSK